jgi:NAD(P)-dependent dehydrogenase (short-subunit alcohol dehydrogenase family)
VSCGHEGADGFGGEATAPRADAIGVGGDGPAPRAAASRCTGLDLGLASRTVIVTGAGGGIGRAIAQALAGAGAKLAITDIVGEGLEETTAALHAAAVVAEPIDASDPQAFDSFHAATVERLGPVHGLVNCAGLWLPQELEEIDAAAWRRLLAANLDTAFAGCRAVLPGMCARGEGSIVNVASTAGEYGSIRPAAHYAAAKAGVIGLSKSLAREAGPHGVRVNVVSPGDTAALNLRTPEDRAAVGARTLLGRPGRPEEIAAGVLFLLGDCASFVTGHVLRINGGALI